MNINFSNSSQQRRFLRKPLATAVLLALATPFAANLAFANGGGYGSNTDISGRVFDVQTYYANSPQGVRPAYDFGTHTLSETRTIDTGTPIRKFVDPLGGVYNGLGIAKDAVDLQSGLPVAIKEKWFNPITGQQTDDDYYEIAIVEYTQRMHSDLPKGTTLRGYVQIETPAIAAGLLDAAGIASEHIPATYPDGTPIYRMKLDPVSGEWVQDTTQRVYFVHKPHNLGPVVLASRGTAVRMKYTNFLPYTTFGGTKVGSPHGGELMIPVDKSIAGGGPLLNADGHERTDREFSQNRASIHWHGGDTPWISDGTPHQWIAPAGDVSWSLGIDGTHIGKGVSFRNVPDMPDPGQGSGTLYFPNHLSGRMMFYHDHTSGLTRLNVYIGEAAGYVITDPIEQALVADAINAPAATAALDAIGIPLVIQDRIYVPNNIGPIGGTVTMNGVTSVVEQSQDAKWDLNHWGQPGDLWYPHVYETNQDPNAWDGTNPTGRWDWGPWFWPVFPAQFSLPTGNFGDVTLTPEAFMDTPTVNGQAYPTMEVQPRTYRFRILNAANDRTQNLSLFQAVDANEQVCNAGTTPLTAAAMPGQLPLASCTELRMVPAVPTAGFPATWPTDGRAGGVPDPLTAGPDIVQIGSEGGLLPALAILKPQPVSFDLDKRSITILNILNSGLLLGGAERADVLIDFSQYAGKTLILYNDAPTPMPAVDGRTDYFTGMGDMTDAGGAYDTLPGYGPNTRTVMQIKVAAATPAAPLNTAALADALTVAYAKTQPAPHIPQMVYNPAFGTNDVDNYAKIFTGGLTEPYFQMQGTTFAITGAKVVNGGSGYDAATPPLVTFTAPPAGGVAATATAVVQGGVVTGFTNFNAGSGYTNTVPLTVKIDPPAPGIGSTTATAKVEVNALKVINKAIQELFDPIYGRMNATLAVELPFTSQAIATTIPLAYIDAPIESLDAISDGETQIWKITHNGVDSHPVHFHLMNVQLINRVDWAGVIKPPHPNEMGWKETITMNPLEDVYVAAKAIRPVTPFGLPTSRRLLDPSQAVGNTVFFTNIDPVTGQRPTFQRQLVGGVNIDKPLNGAGYSNQMTDFDNEYVWHCHILGHEENDFMRPMIFHPNVVLPDVPGAVTIASNQLTWADPTPVGGWDKDGVPTAGETAKPVLADGSLGDAYAVEPTNNPKNEIGFKVFRTVTTNVTTTTPAVTDASGAVITPSASSTATTVAPSTVSLVPANATSWTDMQPPVLVNTHITNNATNVTVDTVDSVAYDVVAYNAAGDSVSGTSFVQAAIGAAPGLPTTVLPTSSVPAPTGLTQTYAAATGTTLTWDAVAGATGYVVTIGGVAQTVTGNTLTVAGAPSGQTVTVAAQVGTSTGTATGAASSVFNGIAYAPVALTVSNGKLATVPVGTVTLTWANSPLNVGNVTGLTLSWTAKGKTAVLGSRALPANNTGATVIGLGDDKEYTFSVVANSALGDSAAAKATALTGAF